jgi:hypothetical protein
MVNCNIEFAHIYGDQFFGEEQHQSVLRLKERLQHKPQKRITTSILVDDYHCDSFLWNEAEIRALLKNNYGIDVDFIVRESTLAEVAEKIIESFPETSLKWESFKKDKKVFFFINNGIKISLKEIKNKQVKYTCVSLSCAWLLIRLGCYSCPDRCFLFNSGEHFQAEEVMSILSEKYKRNEDQVLELIKNTSFSKHSARIRYHFFNEGDVYASV